MSRKNEKHDSCLTKCGQIATIVIAAFAVYGIIQANKHFTKTVELGSKQFELINRPFIELAEPRLSIFDKDLKRGNIPEMQIDITVKFINHGKVPAYIKNVECFIQNLNQNKCKPAMPFPKDKEKQWGNF